MNRRSFLAVAGFVSADAVFARRRPVGSTGAHPTPRKGITGAKVLMGAKLAKWPDLLKLFDGIRTIPETADGIRCSCGCAELPGYYSLLSCFEGDDAMAMICPICQGAGKLTVRLHGEGRSLAEIRIAVDAQFG